MHSGFRAWSTATAVIVIWGITFVNTRALLGEFSALEILVGRFALAWAALGAMVSWGCYLILVDKANERGCPPERAIRKAFGWALVMMLPFCVWGATDAGYCALDGSFSVTLDGAANAERFSNVLTWLNLGFLGLLASAACFVMWNYACREIGVVRTTVGLYLTPIVGVVFAAVFLDERLTQMSLLGGGFIVVGVAIANWRRSR